jgi:hypothetical protein
MDSKGEQMTEIKDNKEYGDAGFIVRWTLIIMLGLVFEFFGRLIGYADNPLSFFHPGIAAFTGIVGAFIVLAGYFTLTNKRTAKGTMARRRGVLLVTLGILMLISFFAFRQIIPLIFG